MIITLPKKDNLSKCDNWQGITLLSVPGKVFYIVDACLPDQQAGFWNGRSCIERIIVLRQVIEQSLEYQQPILNIIDFVKAFDSVHRETLWKIARAYRIPSQFADIFQNLHQGSRCCVPMEERITDLFTIETGVRQGCVLSPMLFVLVINFVTSHSIDHLHIGIPWTVGNLFLADLDFADDIFILGMTQTAIRDLTMALSRPPSAFLLVRTLFLSLWDLIFLINENKFLISLQLEF